MKKDFSKDSTKIISVDEGVVKETVNGKLKS